MASPHLNLFYFSTFSSHKCFLMWAEAIHLSMTYSCSKSDWFRQPMKCWTPYSYCLTYLHYRYWWFKAARLTVWRVSRNAKMDQWQPQWLLNAVITIKEPGCTMEVLLSLTVASVEDPVEFLSHMCMLFSYQWVSKSYTGTSILKSILSITTRYKGLANIQAHARVLGENKADFPNPYN